MMVLHISVERFVRSEDFYSFESFPWDCIANKLLIEECCSLKVEELIQMKNCSFYRVELMTRSWPLWCTCIFSWLSCNNSSFLYSHFLRWSMPKKSVIYLKMYFGDSFFHCCFLTLYLTCWFCSIEKQNQIIFLVFTLDSKRFLCSWTTTGIWIIIKMHCLRNINNSCVPWESKVCHTSRRQKNWSPVVIFAQFCEWTKPFLSKLLGKYKTKWGNIFLSMLSNKKMFF